MKRWKEIVFASIMAVTCYGFEYPIAVEERLGYPWPTGLVSRTVEFPASQTQSRLGLFLGDAPVPMQFRNALTNADGSLRKADICFQTGLKPGESRTFTLRSTAKSTPAPATGLKLNPSGAWLEIDNGITAIKLPAGAWSAPAGAQSPVAVAEAFGKHLGYAAQAERLPGPLLGVKLRSGQWLGPAAIVPPASNILAGYATTIVEAGPLVTTVCVAYRFANNAEYRLTVGVRAGDPFVRLDERYSGAGTVSYDLFSGLKPGLYATETSFRGATIVTNLDYTVANRPITFVGWDFYLVETSAVIGLLNDATGDLLALISTSPDWTTVPYSQNLVLTAMPGPRLTLEGSAASGWRHWGLLVEQRVRFPEPALDLYKWYFRNVMLPLERVAHWKLTWPGMEKIEFPHTFFDRAELPGIRARLQAEPAIRDYMEKEMRNSENWWGVLANEYRDTRTNAAERSAFAAYSAKYRERKGMVRDISYLGACALYSGDAVYFEQLNDRLGVGPLTGEQYLDSLIKAYLEGIGPFTSAGYYGAMGVSDYLLLRYVGLDLLLGSEFIKPEEKKTILTKLAFAVYLMHTPEWQPPIHVPGSDERPEGYGQGTPNQKHCDFTARAITACMLANHPELPHWLDFALAELRPHYPWTIAPSGALLESPFYTSRDTMRYAPFWTALVRAGVTNQMEWMNRPKKSFQYLVDMLTPKEPRMGGRRVYQPIGRSSSGVIDPTFMIGAYPWGLTDEYHGRLMRWAWVEQGKPSPDCMGATGGRDIGLTLIAFSYPFQPLERNPLRSRRYEGMGAIFRSHPDTDYESNVLFRHDPFCWDLYAVNNGAVYFYGKGAPLLPRFGGYWMAQQGQCCMMHGPFGNRLYFESGNENCSGRMTDYTALGDLADYAAGITEENDWQRSVLFAKDYAREDPVYLLVRDDVRRTNSPTALHWWIMSRDVQPDGIENPGVVPTKGSDAEWAGNLGKNWANAAAKMARPPATSSADAMLAGEGKEATEAERPSGPPKLKGQFHHFAGQCGVDVDLFIAAPSDPVIVTDAAGAGPGLSYCVNPKLYEYQQLVRIEQPAGRSYLTLIAPRWPGSPAPVCRTIADGNGVAVQHVAGEDRLFAAAEKTEFKDGTAAFKGRAGFVRRGADGGVRLMVVAGEIGSGGVTLSSTRPAALRWDGKRAVVQCPPDAKDVAVKLPAPFGDKDVTIERAPQ